MHYFYYNDKPSTDYGLYVMEAPTYNAPERDVETVTIPGRNGTLLIDNGRFSNITLTYTVVLLERFYENATEIYKWLTEPVGYTRLQDSYNPDFFRLGRLSGTIEWDPYLLAKAGKASLTFDCKPQKFYLTGGFTYQVSSGYVFVNPSSFDALPLIRVYGTSGDLYVGSTKVQIDTIDEYVDIDCEMQDCFKGTINCNGNVHITDFPVMGKGNTGITFDGDITKVEITPRWWTI